MRIIIIISRGFTSVGAQKSVRKKHSWEVLNFFTKLLINAISNLSPHSTLCTWMHMVMASSQVTMIPWLYRCIWLIPVGRSSTRRGLEIVLLKLIVPINFKHTFLKSLCNTLINPYYA